VAAITIHRTPLDPAWIDYNGHLRDAYYGLIVSYATDALMDRLGLDAAYRSASACTLYTLEMHLAFLKEVKQDGIVVTGVRLLDADSKRLHAAFELCCEGQAEPAAGAELVLLHVHQGDTVRAQPFPAAVAARVGELLTASHSLRAEVPGSRVLALRRPAAPAAAP
jgi:acyl-CoA thioester hydrolase